jgi:hypothetical protein
MLEQKAFPLASVLVPLQYSGVLVLLQTVGWKPPGPQ